MPDPLILSTWTFGQRANAAAWPILFSHGSALDAVEAACRDAEADVTNHTVGVGGIPDRDGIVSLDAAIMLSPSRSGAVAGLRNFPHPISIARAVMEKTVHKLLVGQGAATFAAEQGFSPSNLLTAEAKSVWEEWRKSGALSAAPRANIEEQSHDTIGVLALDSHGLLAGGCTTSGLRFKLPGRVGDSPIIGHGLYVDPAVGAAVATGHGELAMGVCATFLAVDSLRRGASPLEAGLESLQRIAASFTLADDDQLGVIVLTRAGQWSGVSLRQGFQIAIRTSSRDELVRPDRVLLT